MGLGERLTIVEIETSRDLGDRKRAGNVAASQTARCLKVYYLKVYIQDGCRTDCLCLAEPYSDLVPFSNGTGPTLIGVTTHRGADIAVMMPSELSTKVILPPCYM